MNKKFTIGDVVELRSGGPEMTVKEYRVVVGPDLKNKETEEVVCKWFDGSDFQVGYFHQDMIEKLG